MSSLCRHKYGCSNFAKWSVNFSNEYNKTETNPNKYVYVDRVVCASPPRRSRSKIDKTVKVPEINVNH